MSAAGFRVARVAPRLGRFFIEDDERAGAPPVVVIGYDVWRSRFAADPEVIGRRVQLDGTFHTVTGVMPAGLRLPGERSILDAAASHGPQSGDRFRAPRSRRHPRTRPGRSGSARLAAFCRNRCDPRSTETARGPLHHRHQWRKKPLAGAHRAAAVRAVAGPAVHQYRCPRSMREPSRGRASSPPASRWERAAAASSPRFSSKSCC